MKKGLKLFAAILVLLGLTSCGNYTILDTTYEFNKIHIHNEDVCYKIKAWTDYEGEQIQVELEDGTISLVSSINATLVKGECPICKKDK